LFLRSQNRKLGGIPTSITSRSTCPPSCGFYGHGCYAEFAHLAHHWRTVGKSGDSWEDFCAAVAALPRGQLWRHNTAGDLPGGGEVIDRAAMLALIRANRHRRGFTFTHKHGTPGNISLILEANVRGFTVNLSADSLDHADRLARLQAGPVAVVLGDDVPERGTRTPAGLKVIVCPAQTSAARTCANCQLCARPQRKAIVGFWAHGQASRLVTTIVKQRRLPGVT
jgi:hypothetical protein